MKQWRKPLAPVPEAKHYRVLVLKDWCKGCHFCVEFCPRKVLRESPEFNQKGYHPVWADEKNDCVNCGFCERICPEYALHVVPEDGR